MADLHTTVEQRPIVLALFSLGASLTAATAVPIIISWGSPGILRPQSLEISRPARGMVTNTLSSAFLDDFGEGVGSIAISGHTGWRAGGGLAALKLIEQLFIEYLSRRQKLAAAGVDPSGISLWYIDTLNFEAFSVYPMEFSAFRSRSEPLFVSYRMRFVVLADLLQQAEGVIGDFLSKSIGIPSKFLNSLDGLANGFLSIVTNLPG